ncbi:MAG: hypothetical protein QXX78_06905 [Nitrososphaerota archaeon]
MKEISETIKKALIFMEIRIDLDSSKLSTEDFSLIDEYFSSLGYNVYVYKDALGKRKVSISKILTQKDVSIWEK